MINYVRECFNNGRLFYSSHARKEMASEEFGEIREDEVHEAVLSGMIIEHYQEDTPYPSCLIYGQTAHNRPLHIVCAFSTDDNLAIVITTYEPDPGKWVDFIRRKS